MVQTDVTKSVPSNNLIFLTFIHFLRDRERQSMSGKGAEGGRHRIRSRLQTLSCQHRARCGARTHELGDHDLSQSQTFNRLSHPGTPFLLFKKIFLCFWERGRELRKGKERETQYPKQAPGSELSAQSSMWGLNPWTVRSWSEPKSNAQPTEPARSPCPLPLLTHSTACPAWHTLPTALSWGWINWYSYLELQDH